MRRHFEHLKRDAQPLCNHLKTMRSFDKMSESMLCVVASLFAAGKSNGWTLLNVVSLLQCLLAVYLTLTLSVQSTVMQSVDICTEHWETVLSLVRTCLLNISKQVVWFHTLKVNGGRTHALWPKIFWKQLHRQLEGRTAVVKPLCQTLKTLFKSYFIKKNLLKWYNSFTIHRTNTSPGLRTGVPTRGLFWFYRRNWLNNISKLGADLWSVDE